MVSTRDSILDQELIDKSPHPPPGGCSGRGQCGRCGEGRGHDLQGAAGLLLQNGLNGLQSSLCLDNQLLQGGFLYIELQLLRVSAGHV